MRFAMRLDRWWQPLLWLVGVRPGSAYVAVQGDTVRVRFGQFDYRFPRACVVGARRVSGAKRWWLGVGVHGNLVDWLAINGSLSGLVELRLDPPRRLWVLFVPNRVRRLYLSLEDPDALLQALRTPVAA